MVGLVRIAKSRYTPKLEQSLADGLGVENCVPLIVFPEAPVPYESEKLNGSEADPTTVSP
jgi:hypothetical protein